VVWCQRDERRSEIELAKAIIIFYKITFSGNNPKGAPKILRQDTARNPMRLLIKYLQQDATPYNSYSSSDSRHGGNTRKASLEHRILPSHRTCSNSRRLPEEPGCKLERALGSGSCCCTSPAAAAAVSRTEEKNPKREENLHLAAAAHSTRDLPCDIVLLEKLFFFRTSTESKHERLWCR
jgi:hypothetical protein